MKKSNYITGIISIMMVTFCLVIMTFIRNEASILSFLLLTMVIPLFVCAVSSFINGFLNSKDLSKTIGFNISVAFIMNVIMALFNFIFFSKEIVNRLNSTVQSSENIKLNVQVGGAGNIITGLFVFIIIAALFSFLGTKINSVIRKNHSL